MTLICISISRKSSSDWITGALTSTKAEAGLVFNYHRSAETVAAEVAYPAPETAQSPGAPRGPEDKVAEPLVGCGGQALEEEPGLTNVFV